MKRLDTMLIPVMFSIIGCAVVLLNYATAQTSKKAVTCKLAHTHSRATNQKIVARLVCHRLPQVKCLKVSAHVGAATSDRIDNALLLFSPSGLGKPSQVIAAGKRIQWFGARSTRTLNLSGYLDAWMIFGSIAGAKKFVDSRKKLIRFSLDGKGCFNIKL